MAKHIQDVTYIFSPIDFFRLFQIQNEKAKPVKIKNIILPTELCRVIDGLFVFSTAPATRATDQN